MSFVATIDETPNITTWARSVVALATVSDLIRFAVSGRTLSIHAVNSSRTTHAEMVFLRPFFREYTFNPTSILAEGFHEDETDHEDSCYSFIVTLRHVVMLFRSLDAANVSYVSLRVDCTPTTTAARRYKLNIEVLTKRLVLKKYQVAYQPVEYQKTAIANFYKLADVHFFKTEHAVLKLFLDMAPVSTEDFSIAVKPHKVTFGAFTKQILKDRELLKQPMLITILIATDELADTNMEDVEAAVSFRLKDFRTFVNLVANIRELPDESDKTCHVEAYFRRSSDPIVFEYTSNRFLVQFIQITAADEHSEKDPRYVLAGPVVSKLDTPAPAPIHKPHRSIGASALASTRHPSSIVSMLQSQSALQLVNSGNSTNSAHTDLEAPEPEGYVTYGSRQPTPVELESRKRPREDDTDYATSEEETGFGPTQMANKPKSLFD